jgi:hypothetical protein
MNCVNCGEELSLHSETKTYKCLLDISKKFHDKQARHIENHGGRLSTRTEDGKEILYCLECGKVIRDVFC